MNTLTLKRTGILAKFKLKTMIVNPYIFVYLIMPLFFIILYPLIFKMQLETKNLPKEIMALVLNLGILMNVGNAMLTIPILMMAEEKEKHTLRSLMVSSVTSSEYMIGSIIPAFVVSLVLQLFFIPILGIHVRTFGDFLIYAMVSGISLLISGLIGMSVGLFAKNQMIGSLYPIPMSLLLISIPFLKNQIPAITQIAECLYTTICVNVGTSIATGKSVSISIVNILSLILTLGGAVALFIILYKRNGFEKD